MIIKPCCTIYNTCIHFIGIYVHLTQSLKHATVCKRDLSSSSPRSITTHYTVIDRATDERWTGHPLLSLSLPLSFYLSLSVP